jgi:hypothetical protein
MLQTAHRVLSTVDARDYLTIVTAFMARLTTAREMTDVVIAAGIAEEELIIFRDSLLFPPSPLKAVD